MQCFSSGDLPQGDRMIPHRAMASIALPWPLPCPGSMLEIYYRIARYTFKSQNVAGYHKRVTEQYKTEGRPQWVRPSLRLRQSHNGRISQKTDPADTGRVEIAAFRAVARAIVQMERDALLRP